MIKSIPITSYELQFEENKPLPLYVFYTLLGQEYEVLRNDPQLLTYRGEDAEYVLKTLHVALNGFPQVDDIPWDNRTRIYKVRYNSGDDVTFARVCFYIGSDGQTLECNLQQGHYDKECDRNVTSISYDKAYHMTWDYDSLSFYGIVDNEEEFDD